MYSVPLWSDLFEMMTFVVWTLACYLIGICVGKSKK